MTRIRISALITTLLAAFLCAEERSLEEMGAGELLMVAENAFQSGDWKAAEESLVLFLKSYGGLPGTRETVDRIRPLHGICLVKQERMAEGLPMLEEALKSTNMDGVLRADVVFHAGLAAMNLGNHEQARKYLGEAYLNPKLEQSRRIDALVLGGSTHVMECNWDQAAAFFLQHGETIRKHDPEAGARVRILILRAFMECDKWEDAISLALALHEDPDSIRQTVTYSNLLVLLGDRLLEEGESHQAIKILRMVPKRNDIIQTQQERLQRCKRELRDAEAMGHVLRASRLRSSIADIERELSAFEGIGHFDSATRLRMASAYFQINRIREGCLILDQMIRQMEPDAVVESATSSLMRGWMALERYQRSCRTADFYFDRCERLKEKPNLPEVMLLRAQALEGLHQFADASDAYLETAKRFPDHELSARAEFMAAYNILQLEKYEKAGNMFDRQLAKTSPGHDIWPDVVFWRGMAFYFNQDWEESREVFTRYLETSSDGNCNGEYVDDAMFRIAFGIFSEARYPEAIEILEEFERTQPNSEWLPEALLALGDALAAEGELEKADMAYRRIPREAPGFHDEGWMKRGNILKVKKDLVSMKQLFTEFFAVRQNSPRVAEALRWLGWIEKQQGNDQAAQETYWQAIEILGNDPARPGIEDLFLNLGSLYPPEERASLAIRLGGMQTRAREEGKTRLAVRLGWAMAQLDLNRNGETGRSIRRTRLAGLMPCIKSEETAPCVLADVADALMELGNVEMAATAYEDLRKWWPRAPERDRAFAGLGFLAMQKGSKPEALDWFSRYEKASVMPRTAPDDHGIVLVHGELGGKVALARASLLERRDPEQALHLLLAIQKSKAMPTRVRAEALMATAEYHTSRKQYRESLPYFEQIYILFNRFPDMVARAYLGRGQSLEKLGLGEKAREVYSELASRPDLSEFQESKIAAQRATELGVNIAPNPPSGSSISPFPR